MELWRRRRDVSRVFPSVQRNFAVLRIVLRPRRRGSELGGLAGFPSRVLWHFGSDACALRTATLSTLPAIEETLSRPAIHKANGAATGAVLALVAISTALVLAALYPALDGHVVALSTGIGIGAIALTVAVATVVVARLRLPSNNDAWVFW